MAVGLGLDVVFEQVAEALDKKVLSKELRRKLARAIKEKLRQGAAPILRERLIAAYDQLVSEERGQYGPRSNGKDPSALENFRDLFISQITKELNDIKTTDEEVIINIGDKDAWGFGRTEPPEGEPQTVDFLGYYIEGVVGEFAFIDREMYLTRRKKARTLGRFGKGFLISRDDYEKEQWEKATGIRFEEIRHPISGQRPYDGFNRAVEEFDFSPFVSEAIQETFDSIGKSLV